MFKKYYKIFGIVIVSLFIVLGIGLIFTNYFNNAPKTFRVIFGFFTIAYGIYRLVNIIGRPNKYNDEEVE